LAIVSGSSSTWTGITDLDVGEAGAGTLLITNGGSVISAQTTVSTTGTLGIGVDATLEGPLTVNGGTVTLVDGQLHTVTLTGSTAISNRSTLDFEVGAGSDQFAFSGSGSLTASGTSTVNLYGMSGQVTSGTDVLIGAAAGSLALGNVYNSGNFTYSLLSTATSEDVIVTAANGLANAYWKGAQDNLWSVLVGGTATNWTTNPGGTTDPHLTPSATTNVYFSATSPANDSYTVLGAGMTIGSLTVSDTNGVFISGSDANPLISGNDTLTISGSSGTTGITINSGAGQVTIAANLYLSGSSQTVVVNNADGVVVSGTLGSTNGLLKSGTGTLALMGISTFGGTTAVNGGTLLVSGSLSGVGPVNVAGGALGGAGDIAGPTTVGTAGILAPGATLTGTAGIVLTIGNNVALNSNSTLVIDIDAATNSADLLNITNGGNLTLADNDALTVNLVNGSQLTQSSYVIAVLSGGGTITGEFAELNIPSGYEVDYGTETSGELELVAIPEPGAYAMIVTALAILAGLNRRRIVSKAL